MVGNAADDILVGGYTNCDANEAALQSILATWNSNSSDQARTAVLQAAGFVYRLVADHLVRDEYTPDSLTDSAGSDWIFANTDWNTGHDVITDLGNNETATDTDS